MRTLTRFLVILCITLMFAAEANRVYALEGAVMTITYSSDEAFGYFLEARAYIENLETPSAIPLLEKAVQLEPNFAMAHLFLAQVGTTFNARKQSMDHAVRLLDEVSIGEGHLINYVDATFRGDASLQQHHLNDMIRLFPEDMRVRQLAGTFYFDRDEYGAALLHLLRAVNIDSLYAPPYNLLGYLYIKLENFTAAEHSFKRYITLLPDHPNPYDSYGEFLLMSGRHTESIKEYEKALRIAPDFLVALNGIGNNYIFLGNYSKARKTFSRMYDLAPSSDLKFLALYSIMTSYIYDGGQTFKAIQVLEDYANLAVAEQDIGREIQSHALASRIYCEMGLDEKGLIEAELAVKIAKGAQENELKEQYISQANLLYANALIHNRKYRKAQSLLTEVKSTAEVRLNTSQVQQVNLALGIIEYHNGRNSAAMKYFDIADQSDPLVMHYTAQVNKMAGETEVAKKIEARLDNWKASSLNLALARAIRLLDISELYDE